MNSVSLHRLQASTKCGLGPDTRKIREMATCAYLILPCSLPRRTGSCHFPGDPALPPGTIGCCASHAKEQSVEYRSLRPSEVILDPDNPRLPDGTSNDREAINRLLDDGPDALVRLARDIAQTGETNPSELPIAIKDGNKYLILEGNRRFAALKLLKDPALADVEEQEKAFRRAAALGAPPKTVYTLVMSSREEADRWIVLRHTGENDGVGIKRWSAGQTATHRRRNKKPIDSGTLRSMVIADSLEEAYAADEEIIDLIHRVKQGKLTNIGRFFSRDVMDALHFTIEADDGSSLHDRTLLVRHSSEQLRGFIAWALAFILNNSVDEYKNATIRKDVLLSVAHLLPDPADAATEPFRLVDSPPTSASGSPSDPTAGTEPDAGSATDSPTVDNGPKSPSNEQGTTSNQSSAGTGQDEQKARPKKGETKPERYLLQGLRLPNHPERIRRLLKECRSLDLDVAPGVACVMMRVIVELSVSSQPVLNLSGSSEGSPLRVKIIDALKYLDPNIEDPRIRDKELAQAYMEASDLGVQYMHSFVHNPSVYPDQHLARRFSIAFRPLLERLDTAL